jgi:uncharacterized membrane protein/glutaredoxin
MITVTLYTRKNCPLCEEAKENLDALQSEITHRLVEVFVDDTPDLFRQYGDRVPVVEVGPYRKFSPFTRQELAVTLGAARDRQNSLERIDSPQYQKRVRRGQMIDGGDRLTWWISRNYLWVINLILFLYVGLPFLAPILMKTGLPQPARVIYLAYSPLCHQLGFRSWFLFGEQPYYPRAAAGIEGVKTFGEVTGLNENDLLAARNYVGNESVGYKVALCQRDVALYLGILIFGIIFALTSRRIKPLPWWAWVLFGILPIGLDGFSQLISQLGIPGFNAWIPFRESTPLLRTITGFLFGFSTAWFGIPYIEESMRESRAQLVKKFAIVNAKNLEKNNG